MVHRALRAWRSGKLDQAERLCNAVLQQQPDNFDALHTLGQVHFRRGRVDTALVLLQTALRSDPDRADGFASLGLVFHSLRRFKDALTSFDHGLRIAADDPELLNGRGVALLELWRPGEALDCFDRVLASDPRRLDALGNRGNTLLKLNRPAEALDAYDCALQIVPANAQLLTNRAVALRRLDRPHEAAMSAGRALASRPDFAEARFVESVARLTLGDFSAGWRGYEARWDVGLLASQRRHFAAPRWTGREPLDGKTILLHAEQGFGDAIQFVRYAPLLAKRGATVLVEVQAELSRLVASVPGVAAVMARGAPLPAFDMQCPLLSLPLAFGTELGTIPADVPYMVPGDDEIAVWRGRLPPGRPLIGVAWSGSRVHDNDLNRSLRFSDLAPLLGLDGVTFVSLQRDVREEDAASMKECGNLHPLAAHFTDFGDTAAAIACLDAVVSADTAVAHLAGAMGKPLFLMLPFAADFRWLRERSTSPWYPTAQLFRQPRFGDWAAVIQALVPALPRNGNGARLAMSA